MLVRSSIHRNAAFRIRLRHADASWTPPVVEHIEVPPVLGDPLARWLARHLTGVVDTLDRRGNVVTVYYACSEAEALRAIAAADSPHNPPLWRGEELESVIRLYDLEEQPARVEWTFKRIEPGMAPANWLAAEVRAMRAYPIEMAGIDAAISRVTFRERPMAEHVDEWIEMGEAW